MGRFATRSDQPELMDGEDVRPEEFAACITDLAKVNTVTLARPPTLSYLDRATRTLSVERSITILDVGFGDGDMLRAVHRWAARRRRPVRLIGIDINSRSAPVARAATPEGWAIDYRTGDAFAIPSDEPIDFIISSLVTHHMSDPEIVRFVTWMEARASLGWFINDLHRHAVAYHGFRLLAAVARWHYFVRHDGAVSVSRSFRRADWVRLLAAAGIGEGEARVCWHLPFRYCVSRIR
jgi:2-polyprenyl-3-methyl-5-hydroxy-6-metoxy-1,4-benzoquinol methylase